MQLNLSKLHEKLTENKKMHENYTAYPILSLEFRSTLPIFNRKNKISIRILDFRSVIQFFDGPKFLIFNFFNENI